jgi:hypothetical protein
MADVTPDTATHIKVVLATGPVAVTYPGLSPSEQRFCASGSSLRDPSAVHTRVQLFQAKEDSVDCTVMYPSAFRGFCAFNSIQRNTENALAFLRGVFQDNKAALELATISCTSDHTAAAAELGFRRIKEKPFHLCTKTSMPLTLGQKRQRQADLRAKRKRERHDVLAGDDKRVCLSAKA